MGSKLFGEFIRGILSLSNEKIPGCLGYILVGDEILPSFLGIILNHCKDSY